MISLLSALAAASSYTDRTRAALAALPAPSANRTVWDDISCTSALVHHALVIGGDLHVDGRIQILASSNLTVYEEAAGESAAVTTNQISKFARERCSHSVISEEPGGVPTLSGDLHLPHSNLIIGGDSLIVGGVIKAKGLTIDGAGTAVVNARPLQDDPLCETERKTAVKITHGLLHVKNGSVLYLHGLIKAPAVGVDRGGTIESVCGGIEAVDSSGQTPGDVVVLGSSSLHLRSSSAGVVAQSLVIGENSSFQLEGPIRVDTMKVAGYGAASVRHGPVHTDVLLVTSGSYLRLSGLAELTMRTALIVALGATLKFDTHAHLVGTFDGPYSLARLTKGAGPVGDTEPVVRISAGAVELIEGATVTAGASAFAVTEHLSVDDFSTLDADGELSVGGWASVGNFSSLLVREKVTVGTSMQVKLGSTLQARSVRIRCSLTVSTGSKLSVVNLVIRKEADTSAADSPEECSSLTPALLISQNAEGEVVYGSVNGTIFLNARSRLTAASLLQATGGAMVKKESKLAVKVSFPQTQFIDASGLSNATVRIPGNELSVEGIRVEDSSELSVQAEKLTVNWIDIHSKSRMFIEADFLVVNNEVVIEEVSKLKVWGGSSYIAGALLSAVRSESQIGNRCQDKTQASVVQLRDASEVTVLCAFPRFSQVAVELLSGSSAHLACPVRDGAVNVSLSSDSRFDAHHSWRTRMEHVGLAVPPSESLSIKYLTPKTVVDSFNSSVSSQSQRNAKASGWKSIEKLAATQEPELAAASPLLLGSGSSSVDALPTVEELKSGAAPSRRASSKDKRRKKDD